MIIFPLLRGIIFKMVNGIMLRVPIIAVFTFLVALKPAHANEPSACPTPWTHWEGFCYLMQENTTPYQEARTQCISNGGGLATLSSRRQLHFLSLYAEAQPAPVGNLWLGCKREGNQANWICLDGKPMYDVWGNNEPHVDEASPAAVVLNTRDATTFDSSPADYQYSMCQKLIITDSMTKSISLPFHRVFTNLILKGHVILTTPQPASLPVCSALCLETTECVSFNIRAAGTCELNAMDWRHGGDGVFEKEFESQYFEPIYHTL